jgi:hypothetical protein
MCSVAGQRLSPTELGVCGQQRTDYAPAVREYLGIGEARLKYNRHMVRLAGGLINPPEDLPDARDAT